MVAKNSRPTRPSRAQRSRQVAQALFESLEPRILLAATIQVLGGGHLIANNDATPSAIDHTAFNVMTINPSSAIGSKNYTFVIHNSGDTDLTLTGTPHVSISGTNSSDFTVVSQPSDVIAPGGEAAFVISFAPNGTGLRRASVNISSDDDDPNQTNFTFSIQGTGVATTLQNDGLQFATLVQGSGLAGTVGIPLVVRYTGFLFDGTVFDDSIAENRPFTFTPGVSNVIQGWHEGLLGMKAGESRALFIPGPLAYPNGRAPFITPGASLIFVVQALAVQYPQVGITSGGVSIAAGDVTPSAAESTLFTTPPGVKTPITRTFRINNLGGGSINFPQNPPVVISGAQASSFVASPITIDQSGGFATFTITFVPTTFGSFNATATLRTNDPVNPNFNFAISGNYVPSIDLVPSMGALNAPFSIVSGTGKAYTVAVKVVNVGTTTTPAALPSTIRIYLQDATTGALRNITTGFLSLGGLTTGKSKTLNLSVLFPAGIPNGLYRTLVNVNDNGAVPESNVNNNTVFNGQIFSIAQGFYNITGAQISSTVPVFKPANTAISGKVSVQIRSAGNINLPVGQSVYVQVMAHNVTTGTNFILGTAVLNTSAWIPGKSATVAVNANLPTGLPAGSYHIYSYLLPLVAMNETTQADNLLTTNSLGVPMPITVI